MFKYAKNTSFSFQALFALALCLIGLCVAVACTSDKPDTPDSGKGSEVTFDVKGLTRASVTSSFDNFAVYGDMKFMGIDRDIPTVIFNNTEVSKSGDKWTYQGTQYWFPNHEHSFVAVYPLSVLDAAQYAGSKLSFTYTLPANNDDAADIIAATHRRLYGENDTNNITTFQFAHILSLINFTLELTEPTTRSEECFKIHKLEMSGFGTSATINVEPASLQSNTQTNDSKIDILTAKGNGSLTVTFDQPVEVVNGAAAVKMFDGSNAIIMLPQTFAANEEVEITLTYSANDDAEETQVSAKLSGFKWEWGRIYNYNIKLELEQKEVNMAISEATIAPWNLVEDPDEVDAR